MARSIDKSAPDGVHATSRSWWAKVQAFAGDLLLNSGGLAIGSGSKKKILIANTVYTLHDGVLAKKTTAELTLTTAHNVANAKFNVLLVSVDSAGNATVTAGTEGATLGAVVMPAVPAGNAALGFVIINPTGTGGFVGGTTDLDDATVAPNAVYVNTPFPARWKDLETLS